MQNALSLQLARISEYRGLSDLPVLPAINIPQNVNRHRPHQTEYMQ